MASFVTGATGFIGQRLLVSLKEKNKSLKTKGVQKIKILSRHSHPDYETVVCDLQFNNFTHFLLCPK